MTTLLAIIGAITVGYLVLKPLLGRGVPKVHGKQLLKKYLHELGCPPHLFPEAFYEECVERDLNIAQLEANVFGGGKHWSVLFEANVQGSAYQICAILAGAKDEFKEMRARMEKYLLLGRLMEIQNSPPKIACWHCDKEIKETDADCPYCGYPQN